MKEAPPSRPAHDPQEDTYGTRPVGSVPELQPARKPRDPALEKDFSVDLNAPDAEEKLDKIADEVEKQIGFRADRIRDNEYPTEEELLAERLEDEEYERQRASGMPAPTIFDEDRPGGLSDEQARKIREENAAPEEVDEEDEDTGVQTPRAAA